jgi:hypothetical protein
VTGGYEDSPDGRYRLWVRTFGAYGHAFSERTRKTIRIRLVERIGDTDAWDEKLLCEKTYHFKCADFDLKPLWGTNHNLTVVVYAWDAWEDATSDADAQKRGVASNYIATLTYDFDKNAGMFTEGK